MLALAKFCVFILVLCLPTQQSRASVWQEVHIQVEPGEWGTWTVMQQRYPGGNLAWGPARVTVASTEWRVESRDAHSIDVSIIPAHGRNIVEPSHAREVEEFVDTKTLPAIRPVYRCIPMQGGFALANAQELHENIQQWDSVVQTGVQTLVAAQGEDSTLREQDAAFDFRVLALCSNTPAAVKSLYEAHFSFLSVVLGHKFQVGVPQVQSILVPPISQHFRPMPAAATVVLDSVSGDIAHISIVAKPSQKSVEQAFMVGSSELLGGLFRQYYAEMSFEQMFSKAKGEYSMRVDAQVDISTGNIAYARIKLTEKVTTELSPDAQVVVDVIVVNEPISSPD